MGCISGGLWFIVWFSLVQFVFTLHLQPLPIMIWLVCSKGSKQLSRIPQESILSGCLATPHLSYPSKREALITGGRMSIWAAPQPTTDPLSCASSLCCLALVPCFDGAYCHWTEHSAIHKLSLSAPEWRPLSIPFLDTL